jgi:KipI family sensor histidine kinase inhibitor
MTQAMSQASVVPFGDRAVLVTPGSGVDVHDVARALRFSLGALAVSVVPGAETVVAHLLSDVDQGEALKVAQAAVRAAGQVPADTSNPREVVIPVRYDGEDLADVAALTGLSVEEVVARHTAGRYTVDFLGFAPGFPYLSGLDPVLTVPRLDVPRTRVPAGAVGLAAGATCIYPSVSPGGWRLIGSTDAVLFDPAADSPALLAPSDVVRFTAVR